MDAETAEKQIELDSRLMYEAGTDLLILEKIVVGLKPRQEVREEKKHLRTIVWEQILEHPPLMKKFRGVEEVALQKGWRITTRPGKTPQMTVLEIRRDANLID